MNANGVRLRGFCAILTALFGLLSVSVGLLLYATTTKATSIEPSWSGYTPVSLSSVRATSTPGYCEQRFGVPPTNIAIHGWHYLINAGTTCLLPRSGSIRLYTFSSQNTNQLAVQFPGDTAAYAIQGPGCELCQYLPETDQLITRQPIFSNDWRNGGKMVVYDNFLQRLHLQWSLTQSDRYYTFSPSATSYVLADSTGSPRYIKHMRTSANGKWLAIEFIGKGLMRINLQTMEVLKFSDWQTDYTSFSPTIEFDVTDDGKHIAVMGQNASAGVYDITDGCGATITLQTTDAQLGQPQPTPCPVRPLGNLATSLGEAAYIKDFRDGRTPHFNTDGGELSFLATSYTVSSRNIVLRAGNYIVPQLDYLALGDSYSSGEGDTEVDSVTGKKHYRVYTDLEEVANINQPREKCHLSTRSYPYLLASWMNLTQENPKNWDSVTCSGAHSYDANDEHGDTYLGQGKGGREAGKPRLEGYINAQDLKTTALNEFIPGRQKQIEFVRTYKPKVITLTMGGNDVGFGDKIRACVTPQVSFSQTCYYATSGGRSKLKQGIKDEYDKLVPLYERLYEASGRHAKIYVLGYPKFINGSEKDETEPVACGTNIGSLDADERLMIAEATEYMNNVIEQASKFAGVKYIDVENSLKTGRLCDEAQEYVTGITGIWGWKGNEQEESFHPNDFGNIKLTQAVKAAVSNQSLLDYDICPNATQNECPDTTATKETITVPAYFASDPEPQQTVEYREMSREDLVKGALTHMVFIPYTFQPASSVQVQLHSDPTDLGTFSVAPDGSLDISPAIPSNIPAGYHKLTVTGQTYSGEPIEYEQTILVKGSSPEDIDENGTPDAQQACGPFLTASGVDSDLDGIDDACDPQITAPRPAYRVRLGSPELNYQGGPERTNYLYLERNVYATSLTGISGEADSDNNGYNVVGATQDSVPAGRYANLQVNTNIIPNVVFLSFRTPEEGCVRYQPEDLSVVTSSSPYRTFEQVASDTNTCRSQPTTDDLDSDSQPDNTQLVYAGRNGDPAKGETATKLYLFRSTRAAEAQLGISDYSPLKPDAPNPILVDDPTDYRQPWSLLASTQANPILPVTYKKIRMIGNTPYILATTNSGGLCQAYRPANVGTIKHSTQSTVNLTLDTLQTVTAAVGGWCN